MCAYFSYLDPSRQIRYFVRAHNVYVNEGEGKKDFPLHWAQHDRRVAMRRRRREKEANTIRMVNAA